MKDQDSSCLLVGFVVLIVYDQDFIWEDGSTLYTPLRGHRFGFSSMIQVTSQTKSYRLPSVDDTGNITDQIVSTPKFTSVIGTDIVQSSGVISVPRQ